MVLEAHYQIFNYPKINTKAPLKKLNSHDLMKTDKGTFIKIRSKFIITQ